MDKVINGWNATTEWVGAHPKTAVIIVLAVVVLCIVLALR